MQAGAARDGILSFNLELINLPFTMSCACLDANMAHCGRAEIYAGVGSVVHIAGMGAPVLPNIVHAYVAPS